ncbi:MAG TPA: PQQ-binding-like beta-propeller repeat protein [Polyangiales bacterium]|nr:PQQ-binding-like beta-propeller repeat protein [Polyangiales bacterium]
MLGATRTQQELPPLPDLVAAAIALAEGTRRKVILPLGRTPLEFALVRRGLQVSIDCYGTESTPEMLLRDRLIHLKDLLDACVSASRMLARNAGDGTAGRALLSLATRVAQTRVRPDVARVPGVQTCTGGSLESPGAHVPLAFGFRARIPRSSHDSDGEREQSSFADVHALLFEGELWAFSGERRVPLVRGPIMLVAQRMVNAVRALVDAWHAERALHVRLVSGGFTVTMRRETTGTVSLGLSTEKHGMLTWPALDVPGAALPVLRLASDLIRKQVAVDRSQTHNLRVTALRSEIRALRRTIRGRDRQTGFENENPERLRLSSPEPLAPVTEAQERPLPARGKLRYTERWSAEIDGLDAAALFFAQERLLVATPKLTLALHRDDGDVQWSLPSERATTFVVGSTLLRLLCDGGAELCALEDGHVYARAERSLRLHGSPFALFAGGGDLPPIAVVSEAGKRLLALDLRTGEPRWRFRARAQGNFRLRRAGRVLLVTSGDGSIDALDVASGEVVWRLCERVRFCLTPAVSGEIVVAASGEPGGGAGSLFGVDLYSGKLHWQHELELSPSGDPIATQSHVLVPVGGSRDAGLTAYDPQDGSVCWTCHDPGFDNGGKALEVDGALIVNTPAGRVTSLELATGETRFTRALANPLTDDVPRELAPTLRHGALFVPSAQVHVLRPSDGTPLTSDVGCDLVPDFLRVDERSHLYVAEESGHLRAYAPAPQLTLVK